MSVFGPELVPEIKCSREGQKKVEQEVKERQLVLDL